MARRDGPHDVVGAMQVKDCENSRKREVNNFNVM